MHRGYVKNWRKIESAPWYKMPIVSHLAQHLIRHANYKPTKYVFNKQEIIIDTGQYLTGLVKLKEETGLTIQNIRTALRILENSGFLTNTVTNKFRVLNICKYELYQSEDSEANNRLTSRFAKISEKSKKSNKQTNNQNINETNNISNSYEDTNNDSNKHSNKRLTNNNNLANNIQEYIYKESKEYKEKEKIYKKEKSLFLECVYLKKEEYEKLVKQFTESGAIQRIQALNDWKMAKGKQTKSDYHTILMWESRNNPREKQQYPKESYEATLSKLKAKIQEYVFFKKMDEAKREFQRYKQMGLEKEFKNIWKTYSQEEWRD